MVQKIFDKKIGLVVNVNEQLAEELNKPVIKKFKRSPFYLRYLNKLVGQYNNTFHHSINKSLVTLIILLRLERIKTSLKAPKFEVNDRLRNNNPSNPDYSALTKKD